MMKVTAFVIYLISCLVFVGLHGYLMENEAAKFPSECCQCNDSSENSDNWCSSPGVCDRSFHMCQYCQNTRMFDGRTWKVTRGCGTVTTCVVNLLHTVKEASCWPHANVRPTSGTLCYTCCHTKDRFDPHYCRREPDAHRIVVVDRNVSDTL